jgi:hypothetical protein
MRASSGITAGATTSDTAVTLISAETIRAKAGVAVHGAITNGSVAGFYSLDGGTTWDRLPASVRTAFYDAGPIKDVQVKRVPSGSDLADVYASVWG